MDLTTGVAQHVASGSNTTTIFNGSVCATNHSDKQIYSLAYLFNGDGTTTTKSATRISVTTDVQILELFSFVLMDALPRLDNIFEMNSSSACGRKTPLAEQNPPYGGSWGSCGARLAAAHNGPVSRTARLSRPLMRPPLSARRMTRLDARQVNHLH